MPCSNGVAIPSIFELYNDVMMYGDLQDGQRRYQSGRLEEEQRADQCIECGECVETCPQKIPIPEWLQKSHILLAPNE